MRTMQWLLASLFSFMVDCSPPQVESLPSSPVVVGDLVGAWELNYDGKTIFDEASGTSVYGKGVETIALMPDGRFEQIFDDRAGGSYPKTESTWKLSKNYSGRQVVILDGLRNYKGGVVSAVASTPPKATTLLIETSSLMPFGKAKELTLCFDEADVNLCFSRSSKSTP